MHILISFFISSVICWLFRSMLFSLQMFVFLIVFYHIVIRKDAWNDFNCFEFTKARFMDLDVMYPGEGSMCT